MHLPSTEQVVSYATAIVTAASLARAILVWGEGLLVIWIAQTEASRFWKIYEKLVMSLAYVSISPKRTDGGNMQKPNGGAGGGA